jgi:riboflavin kinase/FMN adenylyltransferase
MQIYTSLKALPETKVALTIGSFDGVHRGHQALLNKLKFYGVPTAVLTFPSHPLQTLRPPAPTPITTLEARLQLLGKERIDYCILIPFQDIVNIPFDHFLADLPLSHLLLGEGSAFGKNREGTQSNVEAWGKQTNVHVEYIKKVETISSSQIRAAIASGDLKLAETLLGHTNYEKHHVKH